jgi:hypothetical protein
MRTGYFPVQWKVTQIIMILKPGKPLEEASLYRPISLLPVMSKIFEKAVFKRLNLILEKESSQTISLDFNRHTTIEQVHQITEIIREALEKKTILLFTFLDITQALDKVWHPGLLFKIRKKNLPHAYYRILESYLMDRPFQLKFKDKITTLRKTEAGVPQGSVLGPIVYLIYTSNLPTSDNTTAAFTNYTAILTTYDDSAMALMKLQATINKIGNWAKKWRIKLSQIHAYYIHPTQPNLSDSANEWC